MQQQLYLHHDIKSERLNMWGQFFLGGYGGIPPGKFENFDPRKCDLQHFESIEKTYDALILWKFCET